MQAIIEKLQNRYSLSDIVEQRANLTFVTVKQTDAVSIITHLRDIEGFTHIVLMTAVDRIEENKFQITYLLHNYDLHSDLGIRVLIDRDNPEMESIHHLWKHTRVFQRELHEMFGINFPGSPDVDVPMLLEGWDGPPPMRRDFDTKKYSEEKFDHRPRNHVEPEKQFRQEMYPED